MLQRYRLDQFGKLLGFHGAENEMTPNQKKNIISSKKYFGT